MSEASADAGKFIIMNCDANVDANKIYNISAADAADVQTIKVGIVTKKNCAVRLRNAQGAYYTEYRPIIKWSNEIKAADIKSYSALEFAADSEDTVEIDFTNLTESKLVGNTAESGKRIIVRLTFKDMPHRYRKWTESYEYVTKESETTASIATGIANLINNEWKRARVNATASGSKVTLVALPYDDDDAVDTLNVANKVRFNANIYWTDPAGEGWEANNKHFPQGVTIKKTPGKQYPASAKLVRDREAWAMGYQGILNRGEGTWPIIKPDMETDLTAHYNAITLEFENMYRAADDIQRKTKQTLEIYGKSLSAIKPILDAFVAGVQQSENITPKPAAANSGTTTNP